MNKYVVRITLTSPLDSLVTTEPDGIIEAPLSLSRSKKYGSVLEEFNNPLIFDLRSIGFIQAAIALGVDTEISCLIEISEDFGITFETYIEGLLDLPAYSSIVDPISYKTKLSLKKDSIWSKFESRIISDVNIQSLVDLDDAAVTPVGTIDVLLSTQIIQRRCRTEMWSTTDDDFLDQVFQFNAGNRKVFALDLPKVILSEVETKYSYGAFTLPAATDKTLFPIIESKELATEYNINISFVLCSDAAYKFQVPADVNIYYRRSDDGFGPLFDGTLFTVAQLGTDGIDGRTLYTFSINETDIARGVKIYVRVSDDVMPFVDLDMYIVPNDIYPEQTFFDLLAHTTFPPSTTKAVRLFDVMDAVIKRTTGGDNFYSDFFNVGGCGYNYVNILGLHLRGFDFTQKPFTTNADSWFSAATSIFNLGLGYEKVAGVLKIRIEELIHFYDSSSTSVDLSNVSTYERGYKLDVISNQIEIGYSKWQLTSGGSLIDDPQTQHTYSTPFRYVGKPIKVFCEWIAASLLFELTRRAVEKLSETFDTDEDIFVLAINDDNEAKLDYVAATGLLDAELRYNKEITPGRNFLRWLNVFNVGATQYIGNFFKFVSGLGNFLASIEITPDACSGSDVAVVTENDDVEITSDVLHGIELIKLKDFPLNWSQYKLIRDSPHKAIGISNTNTDHVPYFIDQIDFFLFERKANFVLFKRV